MKKANNILLIILGIIFLLIVTYLIYNFILKKDNDKIVTKDNEIEEYGYVLYSNATKLYKDKFDELKELLSNSDVNYDKYAELISELFIIDFYTLDNKVAKNDIGGLQFIHPDEEENFLSKASDTVYKYVKSNINGNRKQELPEVSNINVELVQNQPFEYNNKKDNSAYKVTLSWEYKKDLGYENKGNLILVKEDKMLYVVEKSEE